MPSSEFTLPIKNFDFDPNPPNTNARRYNRDAPTCWEAWASSPRAPPIPSPRSSTTTLASRGGRSTPAPAYPPATAGATSPPSPCREAGSFDPPARGELVPFDPDWFFFLLTFLKLFFLFIFCSIFRFIF